MMNLPMMVAWTRLRFACPRLLALIAVSMALMLRTSSAAALDVTPESIFREMERKTGSIVSIVAELELSTGGSGTFVTLSIQSPDKLAMDFHRHDLRVVFDGERFWLYIGSLKEVFYLDSGTSGGWISDALREWVNPKKIVANVTRQTLFTLFDITLVPDAPASATATVTEVAPVFGLRFTPKGSSVFKKLFDVGHYEMTISTENYLPMQVREYAPSGNLRGILEVERYLINQDLPKERFVFEVPSDVKMVPLVTVLAEKLEEGTDIVVRKIGDYFRSLQENMRNWGW